MINYVEKGYGLHQEILAAGHWLVQQDGVWIASDDTAVQAIIDGYDPVAPAQAAKSTEIKAERDRRATSGVLVGPNRFHSDPASRIQQLGLKDKARDVLAAGGAYTDPLIKNGVQVQWKVMGGAFVPMTVQLAFDLVDAIGNADEAIYTAAETHLAQMRQSAAPWDYDFSTGWPEV